MSCVLLAIGGGAILPQEFQHPKKRIVLKNQETDVDSFLAHFRGLSFPLVLPSDSFGWRNLKCFHDINTHRVTGYYKRFKLPAHLERRFLCEFPNLQCAQSDAWASVALGKFPISENVVGLVYVTGSPGPRWTFLATFSLTEQRVIAKLLLERNQYRFPQSQITQDLCLTVISGKGWNDTESAVSCDSVFLRATSGVKDRYRILPSGKIIAQP